MTCCNDRQAFLLSVLVPNSAGKSYSSRFRQVREGWISGAGHMCVRVMHGHAEMMEMMSIVDGPSCQTGWLKRWAAGRRRASTPIGQELARAAGQGKFTFASPNDRWQPLELAAESSAGLLSLRSPIWSPWGSEIDILSGFRCSRWRLADARTCPYM